MQSLGKEKQIITDIFVESLYFTCEIPLVFTRISHRWKKNSTKM